MATVVVRPTALASLRRLIETHDLPDDTSARVRRSLRVLETFPLSGRALEGASLDGLRFVLGPWRWMLLVYEYDAGDDLAAVVLIEDARTTGAASNFRA
jgi:hypothetical protein